MNSSVIQSHNVFYLINLIVLSIHAYMVGIAIHKGRYCSTTGINLLGDHCKGIPDQKEFLCQLKTIETM